MTDETTNPQDAVAIQTSGKEEGQTPKEPLTFTEKQVEEAVAKGKHDTLVDFNRLEAEWKRSQSVAEKALARLKEIEDENYRKQEEAAMDDPDKLSIIRERRADKRKLAEAEAKNVELQAQTQEVLAIRAERLAEKFNVDQAVLLKYGGATKESMEELAKSYGERTATQGGTRIRVTSPPDSGKTIGGGKGLTNEDVAKMSPEERNRRNAEIAKLPFI